MRRPIVAVALAAVIIATVTVAGFGIAACGSSSDSTSTTPAASGSPGGQMRDMSAMFTEALDPLVEDGTITSDQESTVIEALTSSMPGGGQGPGQGGQAPSDGATPPSDGQTPAAGASPPSGGQQGGPGQGGDMFSSALDSLVSDGTITSAQEEAISDALGSVMQQGRQSPPASSGATGSSSSTQSS